MSEKNFQLELKEELIKNNNNGNNEYFVKYTTELLRIYLNLVFKIQLSLLCGLLSFVVNYGHL